MTPPVTLLLIDDDDVDVRMFRRSLRRAQLDNPLVVAQDGLHALEILRGSGAEPPLPRPYVILLDLNMPRMNGLELLAELRADPELRSSVVFVLTTSDAERDIEAAYQHNVAGYIVKSRDGSRALLELLRPFCQLVKLAV